MEKLGVTTEDPPIKTASGKPLCPQCGGEAEQHGAVTKCPKCGTKPFEHELPQTGNP
jgi:tRNA(Ile2) C34 agmatinyltransferase TiaS